MYELKELTESDYGKFKQEFDSEIKSHVNGFVKIGFLLRRAKDTPVLYSSGYKNMEEFAQAEYGITKDVASRYIAINKRFSEDGYSPVLRREFEQYGMAKLGEMLTLSDEAIELLDPQITRREIQELKADIKEEEQVSDIEVMLETKNEETEEFTILQQFLWEYFKDNKSEFLALEKVITGTAVEKIRDVAEILAPSGIAVKRARVQGKGKYALSLKGENEDMILLNLRTNEKDTYKWEQLIDDLVKTFGGKCSESEWERLYGTKKEEDIAPVQHMTPKEYVKDMVQDEEQLPGQKDITDYPEFMPEPVELAETIKEPDTNIVTEDGTEVVVEDENDSKNILKGYKAGVTADINKLSKIWNGDAANKAEEAYKIVEKLLWRLEQIKRRGKLWE